jgi:hypothetical protein
MARRYGYAEEQAADPQTLLQQAIKEKDWMKATQLLAQLSQQ